MAKLLIFFSTLLCYILIGINAQKETDFAEVTINEREVVNINGSLYYISVKGLEYTASQAMRTCNDVEMKLISIPNEEKQLLIAEYLKDNGHENRNFWTSGTMFYDDVFAWLGTGEEFTYYNWLPGQPDEFYQDICVILDSDYKWQDEPCGRAHSFICEQIQNC